MKGIFIYDFGDAFRKTVANTELKMKQDHSKITFWKALFEAFCKRSWIVNGAFFI